MALTLTSSSFKEGETLVVSPKKARVFLHA